MPSKPSRPNQGTTSPKTGANTKQAKKTVPAKKTAAPQQAAPAKKGAGAPKTASAKKTAPAKTAPAPSPPAPAPPESMDQVRHQARELEGLLEAELLRDAVLSARMALEELHTETHGPPYERRRGIRLREKALKVERAFNRLRALRLGLLVPERSPEE